MIIKDNNRLVTCQPLLALLLCVLMLCVSTQAYANACQIVFADAAQGRATNSRIIFNDDAQIFGDDELRFVALFDDTRNSPQSCNTANCQVTGASAPSLSLPSFETTNSNSNANHANSRTRTIGPGGNYSRTEYRQVTVKNSSKLNFLASANTYKITNLIIEDEGIVTLSNGTYWIENLILTDEAKLNVNGTATLFVRNAFTLQDDVQINYNQDADKLALIAYSNITMLDKSKVNAAIYGSNIYLDDEAQVTGAVSSDYELRLDEDANIIYQDVSSINLDNLCAIAELKHHYTFDDSWSASSPLQDSVGTSHGQVSGSVSRILAPAADSKLDTCYAANFTGGTITVDNLGLSTADGAQATVSFWMKWEGNDREMPIGWNYHDLWLRSGHFGFNTFNNDIYGIQSTNLAYTWHHVAAVFTNGDVAPNELYINGIKESLSQLRNTPYLPNAIIAQTLSISGYNNSSSYRLRGQIDNLKIYQGQASEEQIKADMKETATCTQPPKLLLEWHLDEKQWTGAMDEIIDASVNGNHGSVIDIRNGNVGSSNVLNTPDGQICRAGYINGDDSLSQYSALDTQLVMASQGTISFWYKPNSDIGRLQTLFDASSSGNDDKYFFLRRRNDGRLTFSLEDSQDRDFTYLSTPVNFVTGEWIHISASWDYNRDYLALHVNGQPLTLSQSSVLNFNQNNGTIGNLYSLYFGDNRSDYAVFLSESNRLLNADGAIDEIVIFDQALTNQAIDDIYQHQLNGNSWDDSTRASCGGPVLDLRFDTLRTSNNATLADSSEYGRNATAFNVPQVGGLSDQCYAADLSDDSITDYIEIDAQTLNGANDFTLSFWGKTKASTDSVQVILSGTDGVNSHNEVLAFFDRPNRLLPFIKSSWGVINIQQSTRNDEWQHYVMTRSGATISLYINGSLAGSTTRDTGALSIASRGLIIGQEIDDYQDSDSNPYDFLASQDWEGLVDELVIFRNALPLSEIQAIYNNNLAGKNWDGTTKDSCAPALNHYRLTLNDAQALTCEAEPITLSACADASCSTPYTGSVSLTMSPAAGWSVANPITFNQSSSGLTFSRTTVGTQTFGLSSALPSAPLYCYIGANQVPCETNFASAGFKFSYQSTPNIANQIAGVTFPPELKIQAVKDNNGVCQGVFNGNVNIELAQQSIAPTNTSTLSFTVAGSPIAKNSATTVANYSGVTLNFDATSTATIPDPIYQDAGKISLHARYNGGGLNILGSSNQFWVRPDKLTAQTSIASTHKAGVDFDLTVSAVNRQGIVTPNYRVGQMSMNVARIAPTISGSRDGAFFYDSTSSLMTTLTNAFSDVSLTSFSNGISQTSAARYSEVGELQATFRDRNYGGAGLTVSSDALNIGRFTPDHFVAEIARSGSLTDQCTPEAGFVYTGQQNASNQGTIRYQSSQEPVIRITPVNAQSDMTHNYIDSFNRLSNTQVSLLAPTSDAVQRGKDLTTAMGLNSELFAGSFTQGSNTVPLLYQLNSSDNFRYIRNSNSQIAPFDSDIDITINSIIDGDGINAPSRPIISPSGVEVRYGRVMLTSVFGPETNDLMMPMSLQYFDGNQFINNNEDNCFQYQAARLTFSPLGNLAGDSATNFATQGIAPLRLLAPGAGNIGTRVMAYPVPDWLKFDWDGESATPDSDPSAPAIFGRFRGNDRIINWREIK